MSKSTYLPLSPNIYSIASLYETLVLGLSVGFSFVGFDFNFSYMLIQDVSTEEKYLAYFGEIVNNTDKKLEFLNKVKFVTDTGEQLTPEFGIGTGALNEDLSSGSKTKGFHKVKLDYDDEIPKQIGVTIDKVDDNENMEHFGDVQKLQLSTDGKPKEDVALPIEM
ncbi:hypothetical protein [Staphylococcus arlettae]|uniref:hypothetical protein n=2 Tax=Staphylococcus arlettae TaxID=29378 RepID=UPI0021CFF28F|nr:hypothetical protein [Staphylococcus arlettae]UXU51515.1 hypothetical protein MUA71_08145 [Staphylococcus arlettae]